MNRRTPTMWVVFWSPSDYPGQYVVRRNFVMNDGSVRVDDEPWCVADDINTARESIEPKHWPAFLRLSEADR